MSETPWIAGYVLTFDDDGEPEAQVLHVGTREDCEALADSLPAIAYSGDRPVAIAGARMVVRQLTGDEYTEYLRMLAEEARSA